jgi:hypothetical protein
MKATLVAVAPQTQMRRNDQDGDVAEALGEIETLEGQLEDWEAAAIAGTVTPAAFSRIEAGLRARIADLQQPDETDDEEESRDWSAAFERGWDGMPIVDQRNIVRNLCHVTVNPVPPGRRAKDEDSVVVPSARLVSRFGRDVWGKPGY